MSKHGPYGVHSPSVLSGPTAAQKRDQSADKVAKSAQAALASSAATTAFVATFPAVAATLGISTGAATTAGTAAISGLLVGAGTSATVPVAGWIVAGVLATTAASIAIARAARKGKRAEFRRVSERHGTKGVRFGRQYMRFAKRSATQNTKTLNALNAKFRNQGEALNKRKTKAREKAIAATAAEMQAVSLVLATQIQPAARSEPMIAGDRASIPEVAEEAIPMEYYYAAGAVVLGVVVMAAVRKKR